MYSKPSLNIMDRFLEIVTLNETVYNETNFTLRLIDINKS